MMATFDLHSKCVRCREKSLGSDPCVLNKDCELLNFLTSDPKSQLVIPTTRKEEASSHTSSLVDRVSV